MKFFKLPVKDTSRGFTLIEILVVIGIIAVLAAIVLLAINPARQFAQARNTQRTSNVNAILNAVGQNLADNAGLWNNAGCGNDLPAAGDAPQTIGNGSGELDLRECIVPTYMPELPVDPTVGSAYDEATGDYSTGYTIRITDEGRTEVCAPEDEPAIGNPDICVTR